MTEQLSVSDLHYRLYYSDRIGINNLQYDCLLFDENYMSNIYSDEKDMVHPYQIIPFCIRPFDLYSDTLANNQNKIIHGTSITFETLQSQNYTSEYLYLLSIPIDVVEHYQEYLESSNKFLSTKIIYICTSPWFGEYCQYTSNSTLLFNVILRNYFENKKSGLCIIS